MIDNEKQNFFKCAADVKMQKRSFLEKCKKFTISVSFFFISFTHFCIPILSLHLWLQLLLWLCFRPYFSLKQSSVVTHKEYLFSLTLNIVDASTFILIYEGNKILEAENFSWSTLWTFLYKKGEMFKLNSNTVVWS